jgi:hypothetical protein
VKDDVFHYASTGDLDKLVAALDQGEDINAQVMDPLQRACAAHRATNVWLHRPP